MINEEFGFFKKVGNKVKEESKKIAWNIKWSKLSKGSGDESRKFKEFIEDEFFNGNSFSWNDRDFVMKKVYRRYAYEESMWDLFEKWKKKKIDDDKLLNESLNDLYDRMYSDFTNNPYFDKMSSNNSKGMYGGIVMVYEFESGEKATFEDNRYIDFKIYYKYRGCDYTVTTNGPFRDKFIELLNAFNHNLRERPSHKKKTNSGSSDSYTRNTTKKAPEKPLTYDQNKKRRYDLLKNTLKGYENQLAKEKREGKDTIQTENEIRVIKGKIKLMNQTHQFEHLSTFENFKNNI